MTTGTLFRPEAVLHQDQFKTGQTFIARPLPVYVLTLILIILVGTVITFLCLAEYARKETVTGYLVPKGGFIRVYAHDLGTITAVHVKDGDEVQKGQALFTVSPSQRALHGRDLLLQILDEIMLEATEVRNASDMLDTQEHEESARLLNRRHYVSEQISHHDKQLELQVQRFVLFKSQFEALSVLHENRFLSKLDWLAWQSKFMEQQQTLSTSRQRAVQFAAEVAEIDASIRSLSHEFDQRRTELNLKLASLNRERIRLEAQKSYEISSPVSGIVASLIARTGMSVDRSIPQLTVLPTNNELEGRLLIPVKAVGFVTQGQSINLLYDAFPYQHFGTFKGRLEYVSKSATQPQETNLPVQVRQPIFIATVSLQQQFVKAFGETFPLKPGMTMRAEVILETRSIGEWMLEPFYSLRGRSG